MVVQIFSFNNIILQPVVTLLINILNKKWIEGIDVSYKQVPVFLNLGLNLKLIIKHGKKILRLIKMVSCTSIMKEEEKLFSSKQKRWSVSLRCDKNVPSV
jgi:hypothetical protein